MNPRCSGNSSVSSDDNDYTNRDISDEKKEEKPHAYPGIKNYKPTSKMSNGRSNTSGSTREEDITQDDLQAMKAMIGDIKRDPSLLFKLSSLAAGDGPSAFDLGALGAAGPRNNDTMGGNHMFLHSNALAANNAMQNNSIVVDDDHTEVSSLGMMSYDDSGKNLLHFSPQVLHRGQSMGARETLQSRTHKDMEIALRMQSLRAKKGLNNSTFGGGGLTRSNSARHLPQPQLNRSVSAPRNPPTKPKSDEKDEAKIPSKPMSPTPHQNQNRARSHTSPSVPFSEDYAPKREENELRKSPGNQKEDGGNAEPAVKSNRRSSITKDQGPKPSVGHRQDESGELRNQKEDANNAELAVKPRRRSLVTNEQRPKQSIEHRPDENNDWRRVDRDRTSSTMRQRSLDTPKLEKKQQPQIADSALWMKEAPRKGDPDTSDQETPRNDDDIDSQNSALILYSDKYKTNDATPRNENRKQLSESLDPSFNRSHDRYTLPFHRQDSDGGMMNNQYYSAVSKYAETNGDKRDGNGEHFKRSSSSRRSSSRNKERGTTKLRSDSIQSESNETMHSEDSMNRRARSELRPRIVKQSTEYEEPKRVNKTKKRAEASQRRRSVSEDPRSVDQRQVPSPRDIKNDKPSRHRSRRRPTVDEPSTTAPPPARKGFAVYPQYAMQDLDNYREEERVILHNSETEERVDTLSSLHPSFGSSLNDLIPKEAGLGEQLQRLNQRDKSYRQEHEGSSSRSVISRLSHMVKSKASKRPSENNMDYSMQDVNSSPHSNISPKKSIESDDGSAGKSRPTLISRISHSRLSQSIGSPHQTQRRRTTTIDNMNSSMTPSDWEKTTIRSANERESPYMTNEIGDAMAMRTELEDVDEMTRLCDERGRCIFHPHIRLQKQKLFGGWKIIFKHCPDCAVEHMKKTQKVLAAQQLKSKKKKHREKKDHIINEIPEIKLNETHERKSRKHKAKKKHTSADEIQQDDHDENPPRQPPVSEHRIVPSDYNRAQSHQPSVRDRPQFDDNDRAPRDVHPTDSRQLASHAPNDERRTDNRQQRATSRFEHHDGEKSQNEQNEPHGQLVEHNSDTTKNSPTTNAENWKSKPDHSLAIVEHRPPRTKKVNGLPWSDYNGQSGRYTGEVNDEYQPHGKGEMIYDRGVVSSGVWYKGVLDTEGPLTQDEYVPERLTSYSVGDKGREEDMIIDSSRKETAAAVALLRVSDAAFVRRSDGTWTYAIVKDRTDGNDASIKFKVNARGSTKSFPMSQWGSYIRRVKVRAADAPAKKNLSLDQFLSNNRSNIGSSNSVAGGNLGLGSSDHSVISARSLPMINRSRGVDNLTTGKMNIRTRSRSRSRNRKNVTTLPLLFSSSMSVSEENEGNDNDGWETASGSGYRLRGIDP